jgi:hypothetical protein
MLTRQAFCYLYRYLAYRAVGQSLLAKRCVENALSLIVASGAGTHWDKPLGDQHSNHENSRTG